MARVHALYKAASLSQQLKSVTVTASRGIKVADFYHLMITNKNTQTISLKRSTAVGLAALFIGVGVASAQLNRILKIGGAIVVADKYGDQINSALNKVTGQKNLSGSGITSKVVPVLSVGNRKAIGIVQVSGTRAAVDQTKAVAQIDTKLPLSANARVLIPINTRSVVNPTRVPGVGVSAVIDIKF